jgi:hypothetical protein
MLDECRAEFEALTKMETATEVTNKKQMYSLLSTGTFGNTVPQYFDLFSWVMSPDHSKYKLWGIRSGVAGGDKRMQLNVHRATVPRLYEEWFPEGGGNISPMIDQWAKLRAEVMLNRFGPFGLQVHYADGYDPDNPWRGSFQKYGRTVSGLVATHLLRKYLWPSDYEDLMLLLDRYPDHVVELSACSRAVGVVPRRNTVIWEVRKY